ncbi:MAG TPA: Si-specific NAD(P)(+) transhydrogenase [Candidatus Limnocylindrales bacterium]|nr:Si-specific NAD(P)(+) transhydrogenase [Candidatus Limnocylindrales bacterium]
MERFDLVVIGSGPAGEKGAAQAAYFGKRVALIEREAAVGGACINTGTVPSKTLRESALYFSGLRQRGIYGIDYSLRAGLTVEDFMHHKDAVVMAEREKIERNLAAHGIEFVRGAAAFEDAHTLMVNSGAGIRRLHGDVILIATGSRPHRGAEIPYDDKFIFDSDSILTMDRIPESLIVVGGGVIGCEYASIFAALGVKVMLADGRDRLLPFLDKEIAERLQAKLDSLHVAFHFGERMATIEHASGGIRMTLGSGKTLDAETALFAAGRRGNIDGLNLDSAGVTVNSRGLIVVNENYETAAAGVYAAGDVIGFPALASTSMEQGRLAVCRAFGFQYKQKLASMMPMGIYTIPEISAAGETEESCREKAIPYAVGRANYENNARGMIIGDTAGLLKLIFRRDDKRIIGVHMIGESATELVHIGSAVMEMGGTLDTFIELVFNYPTLSETYKYAAYDGLGNLAGHKFREG